MKYKIVLFLCLILAVIPLASSYPNIISDSGTNHTLNKQVVYSIPEHYFNGVDTVEFTNQGVFGNRAGYYHIYWINNYYYGGKIWIYGGQATNWNETEMRKTLKHELGHNDWFYNLHNKINNEEYADEFRIR